MGLHGVDSHAGCTSGQQSVVCIQRAAATLKHLQLHNQHQERKSIVAKAAVLNLLLARDAQQPLVNTYSTSYCLVISIRSE